MKLQTMIDDVAEWNIQVGHLKPFRREQRKIWLNEPAVREKALELIEEEVAELRQAVESLDDVEILDAIADILFTLFGLAAKADHEQYIELAFKEVVRANNSKITEDPISGDVKVGKPEGYVPPNIAWIIEMSGLNR